MPGGRFLHDTYLTTYTTTLNYTYRTFRTTTQYWGLGVSRDLTELSFIFLEGHIMSISMSIRRDNNGISYVSGRSQDDGPLGTRNAHSPMWALTRLSEYALQDSPDPHCEYVVMLLINRYLLRLPIYTRRTTRTTQDLHRRPKACEFPVSPTVPVDQQAVTISSMSKICPVLAGIESPSEARDPLITFAIPRLQFGPHRLAPRSGRVYGGCWTSLMP
ncbi:hypothetical protein AK812_SmicGene28142 [Symbiodinium microadriaticum]|uniref:Uncharacterized protein n=1 Tax=Symbiodinium microadriaticum TaxID=2951 RepID=A0A1Q9D5A4_SYMMI|nr:hypothetical protein AK812_SmicGene28142 [Symbiodinium microadriaticum]